MEAFGQIDFTIAVPPVYDANVTGVIFENATWYSSTLSATNDGYPSSNTYGVYDSSPAADIECVMINTATGEYNITVLDDSFYGAGFCEFNVTDGYFTDYGRVDFTVNVAPIWTNSTGTVFENGTWYSTTFGATDVDSFPSAVTYSIYESSPAADVSCVMLNSATGEINITVLDDLYVGSGFCVINASDSNIDSFGQISFFINSPPSFTNTSGLVINSGSTYDGTYTATDDGVPNALVYAISESDPAADILCSIVDADTGDYNISIIDPSFFGAGYCEFSAYDGHLTAYGRVSFTINAVPETYNYTAEKQTAGVSASGNLSGNASDADDTTLLWYYNSDMTPSGSGTFNLNTDGSWMFTPNSDTYGPSDVTVGFYVNDTNSAKSNISYLIFPMNSRPTVTNGSGSVDSNSSTTFSFTGSDPDSWPGISDNFYLIGQPNGSVALNPSTGSFDYTPDKWFAYPSTAYDIIYFVFGDSYLNSTVGQFNVTVTLTPNTAPTTSNYTDPANYIPGQQASGTLSCSDSDFFPNDGNVTFSTAGSVQPSGYGTFNLESNGSFTFDFSSSDINGTIIAPFNCNDGRDDSTTQYVIFYVDEQPTVTNGVLSVVQNNSIGFDLSSLSTDPDSVPGTGLIYYITTPASNGTISSFSSTTGIGTYTANLDYGYPADFSLDPVYFIVGDSLRNSSTGTLNFNVTKAPNNAPVASDVTSAKLYQGETLADLQLDVVDTPVFPYPLVYTMNSDLTGGSGAISGFDNNAGTFNFTANGAFNGDATFTFYASDGRLNSNTATFTIPVNAFPVTTNSSVYVPPSTSYSFTVNCTDADLEPLTYYILTPPPIGTIDDFNSSTGLVTYIGNGTDGLTDIFLEFICDDGTRNATSSSFVNITQTNDLVANSLPVVSNQSFVINQGDSVPTTALSAFDPDNFPTTPLVFAEISTNPSGVGTVTFNTTGTISLVSSSSYWGNATTSWSAYDGRNYSYAEVTWTVNHIPKTEIGNIVSFPQDQNLTVNVNCSDPDNYPSPLTFSIDNPNSDTNQVTSWTFSSVTGVLTIVPNRNYNGTNVYTYSCSDGMISNTTGSFTINTTYVATTPPATTGASISSAFNQTATDNANQNITLNNGLTILSPYTTDYNFTQNGYDLAMLPNTFLYVDFSAFFTPKTFPAPLTFSFSKVNSKSETPSPKILTDNINSATGYGYISCSSPGATNLTVSAFDSRYTTDLTFSVYCNQQPASSSKTVTGELDNDISFNLATSNAVSDGFPAATTYILNTTNLGTGNSSLGSITFDNSTGKGTFTPKDGFLGSLTLSYSLHDSWVQTSNYNLKFTVTKPSEASSASVIPAATSVAPVILGIIFVIFFIVACAFVYRWDRREELVAGKTRETIDRLERRAQRRVGKYGPNHEKTLSAKNRAAALSALASSKDQAAPQKKSFGSDVMDASAGGASKLKQFVFALKRHHTILAIFFRDPSDPYTRSRRMAVFFTTFIFSLALNAVFYTNSSSGLGDAQTTGAVVSFVISFVIAPILIHLFANSLAKPTTAEIPYLETANWYQTHYWKFVYGTLMPLPSLVASDPYEAYFKDFNPGASASIEPIFLGDDWIESEDSSSIDKAKFIMSQFDRDPNGEPLNKSDEKDTKKSGYQWGRKKQKKKPVVKTVLPEHTYWSAQLDRKYVYLAWIISIVLIALSVLLLATSDMSEDSETSWIFSWFWSLIQDIFLNQVLKILIIVLVLPKILKKLEKQKSSSTDNENPSEAVELNHLDDDQ